jgi:hypothetical protein
MSRVGANSRVRFALRRGIDVLLDGAQAGTGVNRRLDRLAARTPSMDVLVLGIYQQDSIVREAVQALSDSRHRVAFALGSLDPSVLPGLESSTLAQGMRGNKFENINELVALVGRREFPRWTLLLDDDVLFPPRFLDRFLALCEHFDLQLAQPAMSRRSHASYGVTRRRPASLVRQTRFVEGGQLTALREEAAQELLPFPADADMWGLDLHWAGVADDYGWRLGVVDATPVRHEIRPTGQTYSVPEAAQRGLDFVESHRSLPPEEAERTVAVHRRL